MGQFWWGPLSWVMNASTSAACTDSLKSSTVIAIWFWLSVGGRFKFHCFVEKRCDQKLIRKSIILLSNFRLAAILNNYSLWSWYASALFENMTLIIDNVRQSIANFSYIYTLSLLQEKRKIEKKGKKEEIRKEKEKWNYFIDFFFSVKSMSTWCLHLKPFLFVNALSRSLKKVTSWSCSYVVNEVLDAACRS